jgi:hypothetical protein
MWMPQLASGGQYSAPRRQQETTIMRCQPCSSHSGSWVVYAWWKLEEFPILPLRMSPFCVFFLLILVSSLLGDPQTLNYDSCMCTTWARSVITKTLVFHIYYSWADLKGNNDLFMGWFSIPRWVQDLTRGNVPCLSGACWYHPNIMPNSPSGPL